MEHEESKELINVISKIGKTPDIIDGYLEGDVIRVIKLLAKYNRNEFEHICKCISETTLFTFRTCNNYLLGHIKHLQYKCKTNNPKDDTIKNLIYDDFHISILEKYVTDTCEFCEKRVKQMIYKCEKCGYVLCEECKYGDDITPMGIDCCDLSSRK